MLPLALAAATTAASFMNKPKDKMSPFLQAALDEISKVQVPTPEALKIKLQEYVQQGIITPEDAEASLVDMNAYDGLSPHAQARGAQMQALQGLQDKISAGGLTDVDRSRIQQTLDSVNNEQRGQQMAIMEDANRRGTSGSGIELANRLMSQQQAANTAGRQGMDIAALAEQAKLQAMQQAASIGGNIETNDWNQQSQKAAAQNAINQFNATNQQQVTMSNIAARNAAQASNLGEKQRIADSNTQGENQNRIRNSNLIQSNYENKLDKAKAVAGALSGQGSAAQTHSNNMNKWTGELIGGINNGLSSWGANSGSGSSGTGLQTMSQYGGSTLTGVDRDKYKPQTQSGVQLFAHGGVVPGEAPYPGDDERNDQVPALLSPGEVVLPRSEVNDDYDSFAEEMPRSANKPSPEAVKMVLQALSDMGC